MTTNCLSVPLLRFGLPYDSLNTTDVSDARTGCVLARVSQANAGLIRRDLRRTNEAIHSLRALSCTQLCDICAEAGQLFLEQSLPLGNGRGEQSPQEYVQTLSDTSGLPHVLCRQNMRKIHAALTQMDTILRGLTRGLDLSVIDDGIGYQGSTPVSFTATCNALGVVLPSNSPGVNSIWLPAVALKIPVLLKPGREDPWTPMRLVQALIAAGYPREALGFYPTDHEGAGAIIATCGRCIVFGDDATTRPYATDPRVQCHGTGRSKLIVGPDQIDSWQDHLEVIHRSILDNGGRSCINASCLVVPEHADAIAESLALHLAAIEPRSADDDQAVLSAFANPALAEAIDRSIDTALARPGAVDVTAQFRTGPRRVEHDGLTFLRPTVIRCHQAEHPLANTEFLFPFIAVVEMDMSTAAGWIGPTLAATVITEDHDIAQLFLENTDIDRLNLGAIPTSRVEWDQPHEGNLFEFLYRRRALQTQS